MLANLRAITLSETRGFIKVLIAASEDDRILGFTAFGVGAGELSPSSNWRCLAPISPTPQSESLIVTHPKPSQTGLVSLLSDQSRLLNSTAALHHAWQTDLPKNGFHRKYSKKLACF